MISEECVKRVESLGLINREWRAGNSVASLDEGAEIVHPKLRVMLGRKDWTLKHFPLSLLITSIEIEGGLKECVNYGRFPSEYAGNLQAIY